MKNLIYISLLLFLPFSYCAASSIISVERLGGQATFLTDDVGPRGGETVKSDYFQQEGALYDPGQPVANGWTVYHDVKYSINTPRYTGGKHIVATYSNDVDNYSSHIRHNRTEDFTEGYISFYVRRTVTGTHSTNQKFLSLHRSFSGITDPSLFVENVTGHRVLIRDEAQDSPQAFQFMLGTYDEDVWVRYEVEFDDATPGQNDGKLRVLVQHTGPNNAYTIEVDRDDVYYYALTDTFRYHDIMLGTYTAYPGSSNVHSNYYDDFYIATTKSRVEYSSEGTWNDGQRELCGFVSWQEDYTPGVDRIVIDEYFGALDENGDVYAYIVSSDGTVSDQDPGTLGAQGFLLAGAAETTGNMSSSAVNSGRVQ